MLNPQPRACSAQSSKADAYFWPFLLVFWQWNLPVLVTQAGRQVGRCVPPSAFERTLHLKVCRIGLNFVKVADNERFDSNRTVLQRALVYPHATLKWGPDTASIPCAEEGKVGWHQPWAGARHCRDMARNVPGAKGRQLAATTTGFGHSRRRVTAHGTQRKVPLWLLCMI